MLKLLAFTGLYRVVQNYFREAGDGYEARILEFAIGKLHSELPFNFGDEFHHLHRREPSCLEVVRIRKRLVGLL